jgi:hypothetical protein
MLPVHAVLALALLQAGCGSGSQSPDATAPEAAPPPTDLPQPLPINSGGPPEMAISQTSHDFGIVTDTQDYSHTFEFVNTGGSALDIESIKTSCGCTTARATSERVAPGERGEIEVTYDPRGAGKHTYRVTVASNTEAPRELQIHAEVEAFVVIEPRRLELGTLTVNEPHTALVTVLCGDADMTVESVRINHAHLTAEILGDDPEAGSPVTSELRGRSVIRFVIDEEAAWGELRTTCVITAKGTPAGSDDPIEHTQYLSISALVFGELHAEPTMFRLGVIKPGEPFKDSVRLYRTSGEPFQVRDVVIARSSIAGIEVRAEPLAEQGLPAYRITLSADLGAYLGPVHGSILALTDVPGEGQIEIPFSGIVREPG